MSASLDLGENNNKNSMRALIFRPTSSLNPISRQSDACLSDCQDTLCSSLHPALHFWLYYTGV